MFQKKKKIAIVVSLFNSKITLSLLESCYKTLMENNVSKDDITVIKVPGAFEIPVVTAKLARNPKYSCVISLGCLIRGETPHFDYLSQEVTRALMSISLEVEKPIIMGVLTTNTSEQAIERCSLQSELNKQTTQIKPAVGDKGIEFAQAALTMIENFRGDFVGESTFKNTGT